MDLVRSLFTWAVIIVFFIGPIILAVRSRGSEDSQQARETKRTEIVNGREYSVYTLTHPVLRERSTGRLGIALQSGRSNVPTIRGSRPVMLPEWTKIQFFRKSDGEPGKVEWRRLEKFDVVEAAAVDYLSRRTGWLSTERLLRYNVDLQKIRAVSARRDI